MKFVNFYKNLNKRLNQKLDLFMIFFFSFVPAIITMFLVENQSILSYEGEPAGSIATFIVLVIGYFVIFLFVLLSILSSIYLHTFSIFLVEKVPSIFKEKIDFLIGEVKQSYKEECL